MNSKILIVDNNKDTIELLNSYFCGKYEFIAAYDGEDAIMKFNTIKGIDLIITEISLPKYDGITLIEKLTTLITFQRIVVISLYGDLKNLRLAINAGANDFIVKPFDFADIEIVIKNALTKSESAKNNLETQSKFSNISKELSVTGELQKSILPNNHFKYSNLDIYASNIPANDVGGDFYDFFKIDDDKVGVVIADVSGKNISAAIFMTMSKILIKSFAKIFKNPIECIYNVNKSLNEDNHTSMFVTCVYGMIDIKSRNFYFINCGHLSPIIVSKNEYPLFLKSNNNIALGIVNDFDFVLQKVYVPEDSYIVLYTDGVVEAINEKNEEYDYYRLNNLLYSMKDYSSEKIVNAINEDVKNFANNTKQFDDITSVVINLK